MRLICQQIAPVVGALEDNLDLCARAIADGVERGGELIVLPELATSGYVFESQEEAAACAIPRSHEAFSDWAAAVARVPGGRGLVIAGFCESGDDGRLYSSAAMVDQTGVLAIYRKTHLWNREKLFFTPGDDPPAVIETRHGRIGVVVCYDLEFPEVTRGLALRGAELIVACTNWPLVPHPADEHPPEVVIAMAAARTNRVFVACCDRSGSERGQSWTEGTTIIGVDGWVLAAASDGTAAADIELSDARDKTFTPLADAIGDRRPELYGDITATATQRAGGDG